ncbi:MAG: apolipoprotein A1/A4/E family protein [Clostridiales bacterium]|nr:apolipoprotein A1/A4/E family protein [Clostridiales bacterium]
MCFKMCKKCCETLFVAALVGGIVYYLKSKNSDGEEMGCVIADCLKQKKDRFVGACGCMKDEAKDMASEAKHAAGASAEEVREGLKNSAGEIRDGFRHAAEEMKEGIRNTTDDVKEGFRAAGETVKTGMKDTGEVMRDAAGSIRRDMGEMKHTADSMFESGEHA